MEQESLIAQEKTSKSGGGKGKGKVKKIDILNMKVSSKSATFTPINRGLTFSILESVCSAVSDLVFLS